MMMRCMCLHGPAAAASMQPHARLAAANSRNEHMMDVIGTIYHHTCHLHACARACTRHVCPMCVVAHRSWQVRKERDLLLQRVEAAEAELERERGLHRRELRRRAKETQEVGHACATALRCLGRCDWVDLHDCGLHTALVATQLRMTTCFA